MILPDSSAWIENLRETDSAVDRAFVRLLEQGAPIAVTEVVVMEVLAGACSPAHAAELEDMLYGHELLGVRGLPDFEEAAALYRTCRAAGETVRKLTDCLVAVVAIRAGVPVLHRGRDFDAIARHSPLEVVAVGT